MHYNEQQWREVFTRAGAFWAHNGDMTRHHALLTSGKHSDGFFNGTKVTEDPRMLRLVAGDLVEKLQDSRFDLSSIHRVVGPAVGAITLAHELANMAMARHFNPASRAEINILSGYTEKEGDDQVLKRFGVHGQNVLVCEDTITTGGSVEKTVATVQSAGGIVLPFVLVVCNRSRLSEIGGRKIISLIAPTIQSWEPDDCPICKAGQGSEARRPKTNWAELVGEGGGK
jgi:orotate phosphoribosyltransferase